MGWPTRRIGSIRRSTWSSRRWPRRSSLTDGPRGSTRPMGSVSIGRAVRWTPIGSAEGSAPRSWRTTRRGHGWWRLGTPPIGPASTELANGYEPVRYFFDMVRPTLDEIVVPPMPEGIEVRPADDPSLYRQLFDADADAFVDHWGGFTADDAAFAEWTQDPDFDPSLFVVGWDGDHVAGAVFNKIEARENEELNRKRGLLDSVFVRRPWRRRGLAAALVARSLVQLRERGMTSAWLGVDADNPTSALGVYERAGFAVDRRSTAYRKPMDLEPKP
ncbi:MAG: GNAT family N-acetyltransferase [Chloroflexi bacterium]|nr:MAG: GNAT family N-acetyltransferase [Chloroflexota bacterium]